MTQNKAVKENTDDKLKLEFKKRELIET